MDSFIYGGDTGETPESLKRKRELAQALALRAVGHTPQNVGEGLSAIGQALIARQMGQEANKEASAGQGSANATMASLAAALGGGQFPAAPGAPAVSSAPADASVSNAPQAANSVTSAPLPPVSDAATKRVAAAFANQGQGGNGDFVQSILPSAMQASKATGVDPRIIVAQAALESGYGKHAPGNNLFGIKGDKGPRLATTEVVNGQPVQTTAQFRQYDNPTDSVMGYADFINSNPRYQALKNAQGLDAQLRALGASGYATDPNYAAKVGSIARDIQLPPGAMPVNAVAPANQMSDAEALHDLGASAVQPGQGASLPALLSAASNPWLSDGQKAIVSALVKQRLGAMDPATQLDMRYKQAQIDHLENPQAGKISYGQTPIILTDPQNKMHMGQMSNGGGVLIDGKVYSSLPAGWKVGTVSQSGSGGLSPEALDIISTQYLAGDKSAIQGFSRNATMRAQLANAIAAKADSMGMDGKAIAAEVSAYGGNVSAQRAAGTRAAQVGMAASEADKMADIAVEASQAVPRGSFKPWNAIQNAVRTGTSSPEMAAFVTATTSLVNAYARAVSPLGAPTDAMRQHAEEMLNTAQSPQAYEAVINQMKKEMEAALNAPAEISNQLKRQITNPGPSEPAAAPPAAAQARPRAVNPKTGQTLEFDGKQWVPVQ